MSNETAGPKSPQTHAQINTNYTAHEVSAADQTRMAHLREATATLAREYVEWAPGGRELAVALTKLEEAMFWVNAGIARTSGKVAS